MGCSCFLQLQLYLIVADLQFSLTKDGDFLLGNNDVYAVLYVTLVVRL